MNRFNFILVFCLSITSYAQDLTISGNVVDDANQPILFANAIMYTSDQTQVVSGASTNENGQFSINNLTSGEYVLKISFLGFETETKNITLANDVNLDTIILKTLPETLGEVTVNAKKPTLTKQADRMIFNVANTALVEGTMLEVLKSTPGVLVLDDNILVKNSSPTIYINDKKVNLSASELAMLLNASSANAVQKIEVITSPSAKYDASSGVVLQIVMSKNLIMGYRGSVTTHYTQGVYPRYDGGLNQFYKTDKINVNLNYSYNHNKINRHNLDEINYQENNTATEFWRTDLDRNTTSKTHNANLNFDYYINDNNTLSLSSNVLYLPYFDYQTNGSTFVNDLQGLDDYNFNSYNSSEDDKYNIGTDLDYKLNLKNGAKFLANAHYTTYDFNRRQHVNSDYFFQNNASNFSTAFNTRNNQSTDILSLKLDYELPINDTSNMSFGIKTSNVNTDSDIVQFDIDQATGNQVLNTANTNAFSYDESVYAGYLNYDKSWDKWSMSAGLRLEHTNLEGFSPATNLSQTQDYLELFPTLNVTWQAFEKANLYVSYKRYIQRPNYTDLNPFNFFLNDNIVVTGNPNLQPSFTTYSTIGTSINNTFTIEAFYKTVSNQINELPIQDNANNFLIYSPTNIQNVREYGLDFMADLYISNKYSVFLLTSLFNHDFDIDFNNQTSNFNQWSNYSEIYAGFNMLKDNSLSVNLSVAYYSQFLQGTLLGESITYSNLSLSKKALKNKAVISLMFADLFNQQDLGARSKFANQNNYSYHNIDNRYVKLGFSYKFGNTTLQTNERTKSLKERERLEK